MGASTGLVVTVLFLFLLVFAALGIGAYQIRNMQKEMEKISMSEEKAELQFSTPEKQIGIYEPLSSGKDDRAAAHVIGRIEKDVFNRTLRWEPHAGRAFESGGVAYRVEDGSLQVDEAGLYHIYSRVQLIFKYCTHTSAFSHSVFVRRAGYPSPLTLMEAHRAGFCSRQSDHGLTSESYLGSALQLEKHDRVLVNVSHPAFLSHMHHANFFGLYKI